MIEHPDDARRNALITLQNSPEVQAIACILANVERKRDKQPPILSLNELDAEAAEYFRDHAVRAVRLLNQADLDEAIYAAAHNYADKAWGVSLPALNEHRQGHAVWATRSIVNMFGHTLSGHIPLRGSEARAWKSLEAKMDRKLEQIEAVAV